MDTKAAVKIGEFSRGGKSRLDQKAADHDFTPKATLIPFGILLPGCDELSICFSPSRLTADFIVESLEQWWATTRQRFPQVTTLVINQDNGPENNRHRTQFLKRIVEFAPTYRLFVRLAYYPPYHSKYNPIERCWGCLENYWNGEILDEIETALNFAKTTRWKDKHPEVTLTSTTYAKGVRLTRKEMRLIEAQVQRLPNLEKWFVDIPGNELPLE